MASLTDAHQTDAPEPDPDDAKPGPSRRRAFALLAGFGVFAAMIVYWALVFTGTLTPKNPDKLADRTWAKRSDAACTPYYNAVGKLPNAGTAKTGEQRAAVLDQGTAMVREMVGKLETIQPNTADQRATVAKWLADWQLYIKDRDAFAANLRRIGGDAQPLFTANRDGNSKQAITDFADANSMYNCEPPIDM